MSGILQVVEADEPGIIPVGLVSGTTLAHATYMAWLACYDYGVRVENVKHGPDEPFAHDMNLTVVVENPLAEPMFFTPGLPGGDLDMETYRLEVWPGIHDDFIGKCWDYTYHERIAPQVEPILQKIEKTWLEKSRITSRDFQFTTWRWENDTVIDDPPCLQIMHLRLLPTERDMVYKLNLTIVFRSRDLGKGFHMNAYAFISFQRNLARMVTERMGKYGFSFEVGRYTDTSISEHLYGQEEKKRHLIETIDKMRVRPWTSFAMESSKYMPQDRVISIRHLLAAQLAFHKDTFGTPKHQFNAPEATLIENGYDIENYPYPPEWDL